ncbi:MAG TPA: GTPase Era [Kiritimatiellia bacterium]|nr:GTPase Era [Kiritimatiellia bacterium]
MSDPAPPVVPHAGIVAVIGRANVGKSSLINQILGEKLSIVSPVAQTTRTLIRGIHTEARGQLVLLDTPGMHKAQGDLGRIMNRAARASISGCDAALLVLDGSAPPREEDEGWIKKLLRDQLPVVIALNKTDLGDQHHQTYRDLWDRLAAQNDTPPPPVLWFPLSAQTGDGLPALLDQLFQWLPAGPLLFPEDILSDYPRKLNISDIIREKLFAVVYDELPHELAVWVDSLHEDETSLAIAAEIIVNKHSQKGIVIGEKGRLLRRVRRNAIRELEALYEKSVTLDLHVRVEKNWSKNFWLLKKYGYVA